MEDSEQPKCSEIQREKTFEDNLVAATTAVIQSLNIKEGNTFSCILCAISVMDKSEFTLHLLSNEHAFMVRVSGFDKEVPENRFNLLPPLFCCLLCNRWSFEFDRYIHHLKGRLHKEVTNRIKILLFEDKNGCSSKTLSDPYPTLRYCELCEFWYKNREFFNQCIQSEGSNAMKEFITRLCNPNMLEIFKSRSTAENFESSSHSLSQTYYCQVCNTLCGGHDSYKTHFKGKMHKKVEELMTKIVTAKNEKDTFICLESVTLLNLERYLYSLEYCKFCHEWLEDCKKYMIHLKRSCHRKIKSLCILMGERDSSLNEETLQTSEDSVKLHPSAHLCKLCNISFNEHEYLAQHLNSAIHKRIELFLNKICKTKEENIAGVYANTSHSENAGSFLPSLHYCGLCNVFNYHHSNKIHKKIETCISNMNKEHVCGVNHPRFYCELCNIQFIDSEHYLEHLQDKFHKTFNSSMKRIF